MINSILKENLHKNFKILYLTLIFNENLDYYYIIKIYIDSFINVW